MTNRYAKINSENIVEYTIVCEDFNISLFDGRYIKVTNETNEPVPGSPYSEELGKFQQGEQPYPSWSLNQQSLIWEAPVPKPVDEWFYRWNENSGEWEKML